MKKRLLISLVLGGLLGIICIIGVGYRLGFAGNEVLLFATWFNRVVMGLVIGLAGSWVIMKGKGNPLIRGALLGAIVSFAWYADTGFLDSIGFAAGIAYGIIIDTVATKMTKK